MNKSVMTALLAGMLFTGGTAVAADTTPVPPCRNVSSGSRYFDGNRPMAQRGAQRFFLKEALGLNSRQEARLSELQRLHFEKASAERQALFGLQRELRVESMKQRPDGQRISDLSEQIGRKHAALARMRSLHLQEIASVLDRRQVETFLKMQEQRWERRSRG